MLIPDLQLVKLWLVLPEKRQSNENVLCLLSADSTPFVHLVLPHTIAGAT